MKILSGFSLMEMMTVLLIVSVVAAASAPMINKRMMVNQGAGNCPWERLGDGSISYNQDAGNRSVIIGANATNNGLNPKLHIRTTDDDPLITFERDGVNNQLALNYRENTLGLSVNEPADGATALGVSADASGANSIALGGASTNSTGAIAIGPGTSHATAKSPYATAIGYDTSAEGHSSIVIGTHSLASDNNSIAIGRIATADKEDSIAIGTEAKTGFNRSVAIGFHTNANGTATVAIGTTANARGTNSIAIGSMADANGAGDYNIAIGCHSLANESYATALGYDSQAWGERSIAIGQATRAAATSVSIGPSAEAGSNSIAIGNTAKAMGDHVVVIGGYAYNYDSVSVSNSVVIGNAYTNSSNAVVIGPGANAYHENSVALGAGATTTTSNQIVLGTKDDTVYIPGRLVVDGDVYLAKDQDSAMHYRVRRTSGGSYMLKASTSATGTNAYALSENEVSNISLSDRRLKNVGKAFTSGLAEIKKLEVFNYTFKKDESKTPRVGVMAQDLQKIFPNAVTKGEDGFLSIRMEDMFYAVVNAVKELDNKFDLLAQKQKKIDELEAKLDKLEKRLEKLEKQK